MKMPSTHALDVLALGRTYINLEGEQIGSSLKDMSTFKKSVSGTCALVSIGLSRLGLNCALLSKIGQDALGEHIKEAMAFENIDPTLLITDPKNATLIALNNSAFFEHHSLLNLQESEIDPGMIGHAKALFLTSDMFVDEASNRAARKAIIAAKDNQTKIILALEMWPLMGQHNQQVQALETVLPFCNLIFGYEEEIHILANTQDTYIALTQLREITNATIVMKSATQYYAFDGAILNQWQQISRHAQFQAVNFASINAHAAFIASFIHAWLKGEPPANALKLAERSEQIVEANPMHLGLPTQRLLSYIDSRKEDITDALFHTPYIKHLHYVTTRSRVSCSKFLVNFGYHAQWLKMAEAFNVGEQAVQKAKALLAQGIFSASGKEHPTGIVSDECPSKETILSPIPSNSMIARTLEVANQIPLQFVSGNDMTSTLLKWPHQHVAKVSITYHPDDKYVIRGEQEKALLSLYQACRETGHLLLIEISPPTNSLVTASTLGHIMQRFYELGIYPDWWQFAAPRDQRSWDSLHRVIQDNDPDCLGVFVHTPLCSLDQLGVLFDMISKQPICKGFVLGKTLFQPIIEQWLSQKIADHVLVDHVKPLFHQIINMWHERQSSDVKESSVS
jgi:5-dehydro-2-deoxygluconokinase